MKMQRLTERQASKCEQDICHQSNYWKKIRNWRRSMDKQRRYRTKVYMRTKIWAKLNTRWPAVRSSMKKNYRLESNFSVDLFTCLWDAKKISAALLGGPLSQRVQEFTLRQERLSFPFVAPFGPNLSESVRSGVLRRLQNFLFAGFC